MIFKPHLVGFYKVEVYTLKRDWRRYDGWQEHSNDCCPNTNKNDKGD